LARSAPWVSWCSDNQVDPGTAGPDDVKTYRQHLVQDGYAPGTIANKLTVLRLLPGRGRRRLTSRQSRGGNPPTARKRAAEDLAFE